MNMNASIYNHNSTDFVLKLSAGIIIAISLMVLQTGPALASKGTVKVQNCTKTHGNVSHLDASLCQAYISGDSYDSNSSGTWTIKSIPPHKASQAISGSWKSTSGSFKDVISTLPAGHYKLTVTQDCAQGAGKHKVFWVTDQVKVSTPVIQVASSVGAPILTTMPITGPTESGFVSLITALLGLFFRRLQKLFQ